MDETDEFLLAACRIDAVADWSVGKLELFGERSGRDGLLDESARFEVEVVAVEIGGRPFSPPCCCCGRVAQADCCGRDSLAADN